MSKPLICDCCGEHIQFNDDFFRRRKRFGYFLVIRWIEGDTELEQDICKECWKYLCRVSSRMQERNRR